MSIGMVGRAAAALAATALVLWFAAGAALLLDPAVLPAMAVFAWLMGRRR